MLLGYVETNADQIHSRRIHNISFFFSSHLVSLGSFMHTRMYAVDTLLLAKNASVRASARTKWNQCLMYYWNDSTPNKSLYLAPIAFDRYTSTAKKENIFLFVIFIDGIWPLCCSHCRLNDDDRHNALLTKASATEWREEERKKITFNIIIKKDVRHRRMSI